MQVDAAQLREFYASPMGDIARSLVSPHVTAAVQPRNDATILGLGYCTPYLRAFHDGQMHEIALMPETQGAIVWPKPDHVQTALVEQNQLPLPDTSIDWLVVAHCLEHTLRIPIFLRELWRILKPEGRLIIVVPNRSGLWAHIDTTPFGYGVPYSRTQLNTVLTDSLFAPEKWTTALHVPPLRSKMLLRSATTWERVGRRVSPRLGGVLIVTARKETLAMNRPKGRTQRVRELVMAR